jgi:hypothetical protein
MCNDLGIKLSYSLLPKQMCNDLGIKISYSLPPKQIPTTCEDKMLVKKSFFPLKTYKLGLLFISFTLGISNEPKVIKKIIVVFNEKIGW